MALPLIMAGLAVGQAGLSFYGAKKADKKAKELAKHDSHLVRQQAEFQTQAIIAGKEEAEKATVTRLSDLSKKALVERGRILAAAGERGVAGASISGALLQTYQDQSVAQGRELYNLAATKRQLTRDQGAIDIGLQINLPKAEKLAPSGASAIFGGAISALQVANQFGAFDKALAPKQ